MKIKYLIALATLAHATITFSDDEPISCTTQTTPVIFYGGYAQCSAYDSFFGGWRTLSQYVHPSTFTTSVIYQDGLSCVAQLPYHHTEYISKQICDYRPKAVFTIGQGKNCKAGVTIITFKSTSSDREGSIVKHEWFVNGQKLASTSNSESVTKYGGEQLQVKLIVTDNTNNKAELTQSVTVLHPGNNCGGKW